MAFEKLESNGRSYGRGNITINPKNMTMYIPRQYRGLFPHHRVEIQYDAENKKIAFKSSPNGFSIKGSGTLACPAFFNVFTVVRESLKAFIQDGMLVTEPLKLMEKK